MWEVSWPALDPYHLGLVLEVLRACRLWQRADTRFHSSSTRGIGRSWESVVLIALGPMGATRTGIVDSRSCRGANRSVDG